MRGATTHYTESSAGQRKKRGRPCPRAFGKGLGSKENKAVQLKVLEASFILCIYLHFWVPGRCCNTAGAHSYRIHSRIVPLPPRHPADVITSHRTCYRQSAKNKAATQPMHQASCARRLTGCLCFRIRNSCCPQTTPAVRHSPHRHQAGPVTWWQRRRSPSIHHQPAIG
jgi:hypothetical protein